MSMRHPQDSREVWVVYDRLWRSKNWLGGIEDHNCTALDRKPKRKRDGRSWEQDETAAYGEALGTGGRNGEKDPKFVPMHLRKSHKTFVQDIKCGNCSAEILERCEQCSVIMHCVGCRKTLCASCAFDRPYTRNKDKIDAIVNGKDKFWWAPGCSVSPCSMQDQDDASLPIPGGQPQQITSAVMPVLKLKWCCTEPTFSGGGGITFGTGAVSRDVERIRAAPLPRHKGWEDPEFSSLDTPTTLFRHRLSFQRDQITDTSRLAVFNLFDCHRHSGPFVPRNLCDDCYTTEEWKVKCKGCALNLCIKHDLHGLKTRICGFKELITERDEFRSRQKANYFVRQQLGAAEQPRLSPALSRALNSSHQTQYANDSTESGVGDRTWINGDTSPVTPTRAHTAIFLTPQTTGSTGSTVSQYPSSTDQPTRPLSPSSNATAAPSRASSPSPSQGSEPSLLDEITTSRTPTAEEIDPHPRWSGCQSFYCSISRPTGDHRRRCMGTIKECQSCQIYVCSGCIDKMEAPCKCECCAPPESPNAIPSPLSEETPFWCPNCRWERMKSGDCRKRINERAAKQEMKDQRYVRAGKGLTRTIPPNTTTPQPVQGQLIDVEIPGSTFDWDEAAEGVNDFFSIPHFDELRTNAGDRTPTPATVQRAENIAGPSTANFDIPQTRVDGESVDMGAIYQIMFTRARHVRQEPAPSVEGMD